MRRAVTVAILLLATTAHAAPVDPQQLTAEMAARIAKAAPNVKVTIAGPLTLEIAGGPQGGAQINLDRIAAFCDANSAAACEEAKEGFVQGTAEVATIEFAVTRDKLRLVVRSADYAASMRKTLTEGGKVLVTRPIGDGLVAILAADHPKSIALLADTDIKDLGLTETEAWEIGRNNVLAGIPRLPTAAELGRKMIAFDGEDYYASMLLADGWEQLAEQTQGRLYVTVASDNMVIIGLSDDDAKLRKMREAVEADFKAANRGVSPEVYRWSHGRWVAVR